MKQLPTPSVGQGLLLRNTATAVNETTVSGQVQDTDSVHTHVCIQQGTR